jgi:predicted peptidase
MIALFASLPLLFALADAQKPGGSKPWEATDVPQPEEVVVGGDEKMRYLLHVPDKDAQEPADGWRVLVVMPGGDGSADFAPFVGRVRQNALGKEWVLVQLVAPKWDDKQGEKTVWPTEKRPYPGMKFTTEKFLDSVLDDLGKKRKIDPKFVYTLTWSSSGPAAYTLALETKTRITGSFVAMSVFQKDELPPLKNGAGRRFYLLHSPQDQVCPIKLAERARDELTKAGADVEYETYEGGHGWHGDVYGEIKAGVEWLASGAKPKKDAKGKAGK